MIDSITIGEGRMAITLTPGEVREVMARLVGRVGLAEALSELLDHAADGSACPDYLLVEGRSDVEFLRSLGSRLYGDGASLTGDERRDLANRLNLLLDRSLIFGEL